MFKPIAMSALSAILCWGISTSIFAQGGGMDFSAGRKITGSVYRPESARIYHSSTIRHAEVLQQYSAQHKAIPADTAKEHAGEIRRNLEASKKELAKLAPEIKGDAVATKLLTEIQAHHAKSLEVCHMLDTECAKHNPDGVVLSGCCGDMLKELKAADELHEKLLKHLKYEEPGKAKPKPQNPPKK